MDQNKESFLQVISKYKFETPDELKERLKKCDQYDREKVRKEKEKHIRMFGARHAPCTFENYEVKTSEQQAVVDKCKEYAAMGKPQGESLLLMGKEGTGKDHLAVSVIKKMKGNFIKTNFQEIIKERNEITRNTWSDEKLTSWNIRFKQFSWVPLLIITDLVTQPLTVSQKQLLYDIIDARYCNLLPNIITTNLEHKDLAGALDIGVLKVWDRFREIFNGRSLNLTWESFRGKL